MDQGAGKVFSDWWGKDGVQIGRRLQANERSVLGIVPSSRGPQVLPVLSVTFTWICRTIDTEFEISQLSRRLKLELRVLLRSLVILASQVASVSAQSAAEIAAGMIRRKLISRFLELSDIHSVAQYHLDKRLGICSFVHTIYILWTYCMVVMGKRRKTSEETRRSKRKVSVVMEPYNTK